MLHSDQHRLNTISGHITASACSFSPPQKPSLCLILGCGRGIGQAVACRFLRGGYSVACVRRSRKDAEEIVETLKTFVPLPNAGPRPDVLARACDVSDALRVNALIQELSSQYHIDVVVYNVGANIGSRTLRETSEKAIRKTFEGGALGAFLVAKAVWGGSERTVDPVLSAAAENNRGAGGPNTASQTTGPPRKRTEPKVDGGLHDDRRPRVDGSSTSPHRKRTFVLTGATASVRGKRGQLAHSQAMAARRAMAMSLADEFRDGNTTCGPVHVCHVVLDGPVDAPDTLGKFFPQALEQLRKEDGGAEEAGGAAASTTTTDNTETGGVGGREVERQKERRVLIQPQSVAEAFWFLHAQTRDAWTFEMDLRPNGSGAWWS